MTDWNVAITGVGGPMADFHSRTYQVSGVTVGEAVDRATREYLQTYGREVLGANGFNFCEARVMPARHGQAVIVIEP